MSSKDKISRRNFIAGGAAVVVGGAAGAFLPSWAYQISPSPAPTVAAQGLSSGSLSVSLTHSAHPAFPVQMDSMFPGLRTDPSFQKIAPLSFLTTNASAKPIKAMSTIWQVTTPTGTFQKAFFFRMPAAKGGHISGQRPLVGAGKTRLMSPFFSRPPKQSRQFTAIDWNKSLNRGKAQRFLSAQAGNITSVSIQVDAVIFSDFSTMGPDTHNLARHFRAARNAEHDEAVAILRMIKQKVPTQSIYLKLAKDRSIMGAGGGLIPKSKPVHRKYWMTRTKQARSLEAMLRKNGRRKFTKNVAAITRKRKTQIQGLV